MIRSRCTRKIARVSMFACQTEYIRPLVICYTYVTLITFAELGTNTPAFDTHSTPSDEVILEQKMADFDRERWEDQQRQQEVVRNYRRICMIVAPQLERRTRTPTRAEFYSNIRIDDDSDDEQWSENIHAQGRVTHVSYEGSLAVLNALVEAGHPELRQHFRMLRRARRRAARAGR